MQWKFERHRYSPEGYADMFTIPWTRQLIERVHATQTPAFGGILSVLYVGDEIAAAHMGLRSHSFWHYWLPAFNPKFARYSPGLILLLRMAQHASAAGLRRIELGAGEYEYKQAFANGVTLLAGGAVDRVALIGAARRWRWRRRRTGVRLTQTPR